MRQSFGGGDSGYAGQGVERSRSADHRGDVFPRLATWVGYGAVAGVLLSVIGNGLENTPVRIALTAAVGAILGTFLGLSRSVWRFSYPSSPPVLASRQDQLWDPWLDSGRDVADPQTPLAEVDSAQAGQLADPDTINRLSAKRASVRPHILSPETGETIRLEDEIGRLVEQGYADRIGLIGGPGSGKTTALQHLAAILPPWALARVQFVDDPRGYADTVAFGKGDAPFIISAGSDLPVDPRRKNYHLSSWNQDELIEYLLAVHADRCAWLWAA